MSKNFKAGNTQITFWFGLSLAFSVLFALLGLQQAFSSDYVVQDDARQHVFWMQRFLDRQLFPDDLIANYFESVAPAGYTAVYRSFSSLGVSPLLLNKLLPMGLGLVTTAYCFGVCLELLPIPIAGFVSSLLLNQGLWMKDDLISATPRAFLCPLFLAFLYYLLQRDTRPFLWKSLLPCLVTIALLGLFYPQYIFIAIGVLILRLTRWRDGRLRLSHDRADYYVCFLGLAVAGLILLPFALETSEFGPTITASEARQLPEFLRRGRASFFVDDPLDYWLFGRRSGMFPRSLFTPITLFAALILPILLRYPERFPLVRHITRHIAILPQLILAAIGLFFAAHALLFKLHLPSRYTGYSLRLVMTLAAAIALVILLDSLLTWARIGSAAWQRWSALSLVGLLSILLILYPLFVHPFPLTAYQTGEFPALYQFFAQQPKTSRIASLSEEAGNLPAFSQRSVLVAREYAIPYQIGYYRQFRQRMFDVIQAQYSPDLAELKRFITTYKVDFWLLERSSFSVTDFAKNRWFRQFQPVTEQALSRLKSGQTPALAKVSDRCQVFASEPMQVVSAQCILQLPDR